MELDRLAHRYHQLRRATPARTVFDVVALIFIGCGLAFWGVAFWQLLTPPAILSLLSVQAAVLALVFSLAAPLLLSMLVPTTPAGQLLQKTQWRTIGFPVIIACAAFLTYQAEIMIELWLSAQPGVRELGNARALAVALVIAFVVIPALAWVQVSPALFLQQIEQAHAVRKLELQQNGELAIIKARVLWAKQKAAVEYANLLPTERQEVLDTMRALFMSIGDTQRSIAGTLGISAAIERDVMDDTQIADLLDRMAEGLEAREVNIPALADATPARDEARVLYDAFQRTPPDSVPSAPERASATPAPRATPTQGSAAHDGAYTVAYVAFGAEQAWTVRELADVIKVAESTARAAVRGWEQAQLVSGRGLANGRYRFIA